MTIPIAHPGPTTARMYAACLALIVTTTLPACDALLDELKSSADEEEPSEPLATPPEATGPKVRLRQPPLSEINLLDLRGEVDDDVGVKATKLGWTATESGELSHTSKAGNFTATIASDGSLRVEQGKSVVMVPAGDQAGTHFGRRGRPTLNKAERKLLEESEGLRTQLRVSSFKRDSARQLRALDNELEQLASRVATAPNDVKESIVRNWRACSLAGDPSAVDSDPSARALQAIAHRACKLARARLRAFVGKHFPPGSTHAFDAPQLDRANAGLAPIDRFGLDAQTGQ